MPNLVFDFKSVNTALYASSDPVPVVDGTAITGTEGFKFLGKPLNFKALPLFLSSVEIPLAKSIVLPPPIATRQSKLFFFFFF